MDAKPEYRRDIDGLRAIAVLSVVLYHFDFGLFPGGFVGVDVFFVISGFLITGIVLREINATGRIDFFAFYERRVRRLFPAMLATIAGSVVVAIFLLSPPDLSTFLQSTVAAAVGVANIFFWMQSGYFDASALEKPLLHMWSLGVEEQFYVVWPLALLLVARRSNKWLPVLFGAVFMLSLLAGLYVLRGFPGQAFLTEPLADGPSIAFYLTPFRGFEFVLGAALCLLPKAPKALAEVAAIVGMAMIAFAIFGFDHTTPFPSYFALLPAGGAALTIYGGQSKHAGSILRFKPAVWVGLISYSLYLVHWPLVSFYRYGQPGALSSPEKIGLLLAAIVLGAVSYYLIEQPFRRPTSVFYLPRKQLFSGAAVGLGAIATVWVVGLNGMPWRFPGLPFGQAYASEYGGQDCSFPGCTTGGGTRPILVVGDSFARQLYAGMVAEFPEQTFDFLDQRTCNTWSLTWAQWNDRPNHAEICKSERAPVLQRLSAGEPVIFASHWDNTTELYDAASYQASGEIIRKSLPRTEAYNFAAEEIGALVRASIAPILIVANPPDVTPIGDIEACLVRSIRDSSVDCQHTALEDINQRRSMARLLAGTGIPVVDAFTPFCDEIECLNFDAGGFFYSDAYHLSRRGSEVLAQKTRREFEDFFASVNEQAIAQERRGWEFN